MRLTNALVDVASVVGAVATLGALFWWLAWPRIRDYLRHLANEVEGVKAELSSDQPDTVSRHARVAAAAARELPALRAEMADLVREQSELRTWRIHTDHRLTGVEQALVALLGSELKNRIVADDQQDHHTTEGDHP